MFIARLLLPVLAFVLPSALAQTCSGDASVGTAAPGTPHWLETVKHQGIAPFAPAGYKVFRNVKDYGAKGDGSSDDTEAINKAINDGARCGQGCPSTTLTPAIVYFPAGTYVVSAPIVAIYYTQLIGDAGSPPTLKASAGFAGLAVIDSDPYAPGGINWYTNQNNFYRSVRNFVIDVTGSSAPATGIHWQVSQSTSLINMRFELGKGTQHQGMFMENGSGGFMGDLVFNGGKFGMWLGNQQFTVRNVTVNDADTAIYSEWNWGWTFQGVTISNSNIGFDLKTGGLTEDTQTVGNIALIDAVINNTPIGIRSSTASGGVLHGGLILNNMKLNNVPVAVAVADGTTVLAGGSTTIASWGQGNVYAGSAASAPKFTQGEFPAGTKDASLLDSAGRIFGKSHPQYAGYDASQIVSLRDEGLKGDGTSDDTAALQAALDKYAGCKVLFLDAGFYIVTDTVKIPPGTRLVGEAWSVLAGKGAAFADMANPKVVFQVGQAGEKGAAEFTDIMFATVGNTPGAIVIEWNIAGDAPGAAGMWDAHIRLGGAKGTEQDLANCPTTGADPAKCSAAFLSLHLTKSASAYLEGTWAWLADHDIEDAAQAQITLFSGRGILSESQGPVWMVGTAAEHHAMYQYALVGAKNHYMGLIQTETPYYQPQPAAPAPFTVDAAFHDPTSAETSAWGLWVENSSGIFVFGAGLYSFFQNYVQDACLDASNCQSQMVNIDTASDIAIFGLNTLGVVNSLSVDQKPVIESKNNPNGFTQTVAVWTQK